MTKLSFCAIITKSCRTIVVISTIFVKALLVRFVDFWKTMMMLQWVLACRKIFLNDMIMDKIWLYSWKVCSLYNHATLHKTENDNTVYSAFVAIYWFPKSQKILNKLFSCLMNDSQSIKLVDRKTAKGVWTSKLNCGWRSIDLVTIDKRRKFPLSIDLHFRKPKC